MSAYQFLIHAQPFFSPKLVFLKRESLAELEKIEGNLAAGYAEDKKKEQSLRHSASS